MHKLKLDLDQLSVESFGTDPFEGARRGTVEAHSQLCSLYETCPVSCNDTCGTCDPSCVSCVSCNQTCYNTCGPSCYGTCATCQTNCQQESCVYVCP
jgi:hypothetical protein